jgi:hypothetical protein
VSILLLAALLAALAAGCGTQAPGPGVDVPRLEQELQTEVHLAQLNQGFDVTVHAACHPAGSSGLEFSCRIDTISPTEPLNSWTVNVSCAGTDPRTVARCATDDGYALQ